MSEAAAAPVADGDEDRHNNVPQVHDDSSSESDTQVAADDGADLDLLVSSENVDELLATAEGYLRVVKLNRRLHTLYAEQLETTAKLKAQLSEEKRKHRECRKEAQQLKRMIEQNDPAAADPDENATVGFPKFVPGEWGPGDIAQYELAQNAAIRIKNFATAIPLLVQPRPPKLADGFVNYMVLPLMILPIHKLVKLPFCPTCGKKMRNMGINPKGVRKMVTLSGPVLVLAYKYGCYAMEGGKPVSSNAHTFLSYTGSFLQACGKAVQHLINIYECKEMLIDGALLAAMHHSYCNTSTTLSQITKMWASIYSRNYLSRVAAFLAQQSANSAPGTLHGQWAKNGHPVEVCSPPGLTHHDPYFDFLSSDSVRDLTVWYALRCQHLYDSVMSRKVGRVLSGDHVFSALRLTLVAGHRAFKGMYTLMNEYNVCVMCVWITDESYDALANAFAALRKRYVRGSHLPMRIIYVDKCCGRGGFADKLRGKMKFTKPERDQMIAQWSAVVPADDLAHRVQLLDLEPAVKLDLAHGNFRQKKALDMKDPIQAAFFEQFRQAHWLLAPPYVGSRWTEVPHDHRSIPQPLVLVDQLDQLLGRFSEFEFVTGASFVKAWDLHMVHAQNGCFSDVTFMDMAISAANGQLRTARSSSQNEGIHRKLTGAADKGYISGTQLTGASHRAVVWSHNSSQQARFFGGKTHVCTDITLLFEVRNLFHAAYQLLPVLGNPWNDAELPPQGSELHFDPLFDLYIHTDVVKTSEAERATAATDKVSAKLGLPVKLYQGDNRSLGILPSPPDSYLSLPGWIVHESTSLLHALHLALFPLLAPTRPDLRFEDVRRMVFVGVKSLGLQCDEASVNGTLDTCSPQSAVCGESVVTVFRAVAAATMYVVCVASGEAHALVFPPPPNVDPLGAVFLELRQVAWFAALVPHSDVVPDPAAIAPLQQIAPTTIRLAVAKTNNTVALQAAGHAIVTAPRTGNADRAPKERWTAIEIAKLHELVKKHTAPNGGKKWNLIHRDWILAAAVAGSQLKMYTNGQMTSKFQSLLTKAIQPVAKIVKDAPNADAIPDPLDKLPVPVDALKPPAPATAPIVDRFVEPESLTAPAMLVAVDSPQPSLAHNAEDEDPAIEEQLQTSVPVKRIRVVEPQTEVKSSIAKKKHRAEVERPEHFSPAHPWMSGTKVFLGRVSTTTNGVPTKKGGVFWYELDGFDSPHEENVIFLTPPKGVEVMTVAQCNAVRKSNKEKKK